MECGEARATHLGWGLHGGESDCGSHCLELREITCWQSKLNATGNDFSHSRGLYAGSNLETAESCAQNEI
jgi:hypothetical protein